ncbi:hypothetical protein LF887_19065 [Chryseobacterium sp. MEBOG06]|uniref:hypothetical protein n=1 Tax=Chryseobacterium sp. MEBOG06 TaxID=2879938 RepID=UPI001F19D413|nr:hypothetical protein [Chryseobacterium sp. MEBOG06]UKB83093.1 hypothetical protein LF887_19065 [Chryseobacterium sp. MEBOG06]
MTQAEILNLIDEELFMNNIKTEITEEKIVWTDNFGAENSVSVYQTAVNSYGILAWWQYNEAGKEQVYIRINERTLIMWRPPINNPYSNARLYFYEHYLIIKYQDKHRERLFIFNIQTLNCEEIILKNLTTQIQIVGNELLLRGFYSDEEFIKITLYPDHFEKEIVDEAYINQKNITLS